VALLFVIGDMLARIWRDPAKAMGLRDVKPGQV
jgi:hypothetical protein